MAKLNVQGQENLVKPGFYMPNRLSIEAGKALHHMLEGRVCYLVDSTFPPAPEIMEYLKTKDISIEYFDFRHTTSRAVREQILAHMNTGRSVVFLPGQVAKTRGTLADVPSPFLKHLGSLHIAPVPVFLGYYGDTLTNLYRDNAEEGCCEEFHILRKLAPGPQTGERLLGAWMEKGEELFSARPLLEGSLTTRIVHTMCAHPHTEITDGLSGMVFSNYKLLGVAMTIARVLKKRGERRVGIILPPGPAGTLALISCLLAGVTPVMINYASSRAAFESTVRQAQLKTFITARKFIEKLPGFPWPAEEQLLVAEDLLHKLSKPALLANVLLARAAPASLICKMYDTDAHRGRDEAVMLFTSGSSGEPKGVALTHRMILANVAQCACRIDLHDERFLGSLPIFHSFGLTVTLMLPLLCGYPIYTYPNPTDARTLCELTVKHRLTLLCATPTFARAMLRRANEKTFASVRCFIVGAEKLQEDVEKGFEEKCGVRLMEGYGLTEATPVCSVNVADAPPVPGSAFYVPGLVKRSIGAPLPGIAVRITDVDDDSRVLPNSERGMIWFRGANIFSGYVGKPELNADIFRDGWFKSGDIGQLDLNGFITLGGRLSRFSKIGGEMVPHEAIEQAIGQILRLNPEDGLKIAITGVVDKQKGEALVLLSALSEHQRSSREREILNDIRAQLAARDLPNLWAPRYLVPVEAIPVLATGKLDLRGCRLLAEEAL